LKTFHLILANNDRLTDASVDGLYASLATVGKKKILTDAIVDFDDKITAVDPADPKKTVSASLKRESVEKLEKIKKLEWPAPAEKSTAQPATETTTKWKTEEKQTENGEHNQKNWYAIILYWIFILVTNSYEIY